MRGKQLLADAETQSDRITPAHAGKTQREGQRNFDRSDHPRTCGENANNGMFTDRVLGSPPHMRGKLTIVMLVFT